MGTNAEAPHGSKLSVAATLGLVGGLGWEAPRGPPRDLTQAGRGKKRLGPDVQGAVVLRVARAVKKGDKTAVGLGAGGEPPFPRRVKQVPLCRGQGERG